MNHKPWQAIFDAYNIQAHDFSQSPFLITAEQIKKATAHFTTTNEREVRVLCKQDSREDRPKVFSDNGLFLLPVKNGIYVIIKGEGYIDVPAITSKLLLYKSKLDFDLDTSKIGNSEMQHLDFAYASSLIRSFLDDHSLVLTIRGRKYTPRFDFTAGDYNQTITAESVQTEVDAGYEGKEQVVLIEQRTPKHATLSSGNCIIRIVQWQTHTSKKVKILFFEKRQNVYSLWVFEFTDILNYNSIRLVNSARYEIAP
ncbi:MAG: hypothetical protein MdMp014T_1519 [Treponematales bacterium]